MTFFSVVTSKVMLVCIVALLMLVSLSRASSKHSYNEGGIHIERDKNDGSISVSFPPDADCFQDCPEADRCLIGMCFALCYDNDPADFHISEKELNHAFHTDLNFIERGVAGSPATYIAMFDGSDGSEKDGLISPLELQYAKGCCPSLKKINNYLCPNCAKYTQFLEDQKLELEQEQ